MYKVVANFFNQAGHLANIRLENRYAVYLIMAFFALLYASASSVLGISEFSPDSWAYFELSKTVFSDNFYKFNTFSSYFSNEYFIWQVLR